jgi:hypothetical protein
MECACNSSMRQVLRAGKTKEIVLVLAVCCPLVLCLLLSPSFRYEKASMGSVEIRYDKFTGVIYLRNSINPKSGWIRTGNKDIMEAKYQLAEKQLEEAIKETKREIRRKPKKSDRYVIVIPASP